MSGEIRIRVAAGALAVLCLAAARCDGEATFFSFLPSADDLPPAARVTLTPAYAPSGSTWAEGLDERSVFRAELASRGDGGRWWTLRIGRGGQVTSFRGPFGESVPPQVHEGAPWIDEVWQIVSVSSGRQNRDRLPGGRRPLAYFIHGSGIYLRDPKHAAPFYCPMLATDWNPAAGCYAVLAWGQQAHVPTVYRSGALYTTVFRAAAEGVVEVTYAVHNFGQDVLDYFNTPWGGVRHTTLPVHVLSRPDGTWGPAGGRFGDRDTTVNVTETGGWSAFVQSDRGGAERWGLGLVFGRDATLAGAGGAPGARDKSSPFSPTRYRWGYAGNPDRPNLRDYFVAVVNPRCRVRPGQTFWYRVYFVVDTVERLPETARRLVPHTGCGLIVPERAKTPLVAVTPRTLGLTQGNQDGDRTLFRTYAWPAEGTVPLFLLRETATGRLCVTDDPYRFASTEPFENPYPPDHPKHGRGEGLQVLRPYDGRTAYLGLLGYGVRTEAAKERGPHATVGLADVLKEAGLNATVEAGDGLRVMPASATPAPAAPGAPAAAAATGTPGGYTPGRSAP